ncbi:hypothetical protein [Streptomyces sp. NPDC005955]|uniref:hypothetical protein n=1 Tax=Streptomyces sp. NPDC005955 TaxID=3364738 RepID=UPI0036B58876
MTDPTDNGGRPASLGFAPVTTEPDFLHATRTSYDTLAVDYEARARGELDAKPMERALLGLFAEQVSAAPRRCPCWTWAAARAG